MRPPARCACALSRSACPLHAMIEPAPPVLHQAERHGNLRLYQPRMEAPSSN